MTNTQEEIEVEYDGAERSREESVKEALDIFQALLILPHAVEFTSRKTEMVPEGENNWIRRDTYAHVRYEPKEQRFYISDYEKSRGYWGYNGDSPATAGRQGWKMERISGGRARQIPLSDLCDLLKDVPLKALEKALRHSGEK